MQALVIFVLFNVFSLVSSSNLPAVKKDQVLSGVFVVSEKCLLLK